MPAARDDLQADVAVIGGGFTGISAALHLAERGAQVVVLEAERVGWGASGRNGGFCCLGGAAASDDALDARFGMSGRIEWHAAEKAAVDLVASVLARLDIHADTHSKGETQLAHRQSDFAGFESVARRVEENYGVTATILGEQDLNENGLAGPFHGAITIPIGFGLNPRKYLSGLLRGALDAGATVREHSLVSDILRDGSGIRLRVKAGGTVRADRLIIATNGYSSEDVPDWLAGRYMPAQSTVLVTRPLTDDELAAAGWTSAQMSYDSRKMLHYFRLMPNRRFLFGMRGGLLSSPRAEAAARARVRRDFERMFPAWSKVESPHRWSGFVSLARDLLPFAGAVSGDDRMFAGLCYHGNGVAMGTFTGKLLADLVSGRTPDLYPAAMRSPLPRFPLGRWRRALMPPVYATRSLADY